MTRTFVGVWPPPAVRAALLAIPRPDVAGVRWVPAENLHATLRFVGDVDADVVADRLRQAALPRVTATLGPAVAMLGRRVVMAPVAGLDPLAAAVAGATVGLGTSDDRPFAGHVTLARCKDPEAGREVCGAGLAATFEVAEVAVVTSETHPDGARYTTEEAIATGPGG